MKERVMTIRFYALIVGIVFILVGAAGFVPGLTPMAAMAPQDRGVTMMTLFGYELHLFPVNILHDLVHIGFGLWGVIAARGLGAARTFFRAVAAIYGLLTVMGLVPALATFFGLIPLYGNDVWLHAALALVGVYFGWVHRDPANAA
jgi:hypothetical protein